MEFYTKYRRPKKELTDYTKVIPIVETAGYIDAQTRINNLIMAGRRLVEARAEAYDLVDGQEDAEIDPTRSGDFDLADASAYQMSLNARFSAKQAADAALASQEALKTDKKEVADGQVKV